MKTIDEAISHCLDVAEINENIAYNTDAENWMNIAQCEKCAKEHRQLAEWLTDYKRLLSISQGHEDDTNLQPTCNLLAQNDCVSRQAVIEIVKRIQMDSGFESEKWKAIEEIESLPSAEPHMLTEIEKSICKLYLDDLDKHKSCNEYRLLMGLIDGSVSADPKRKPGKWIVWGGMDIPENHGRHKCSECGNFAPYKYKKPVIKEDLTEFCPRCGADMRGKNG